ncbi:hypothetical protein MPER_10809, partial [Moniliophthora perniciosa FA553]
MPTNTITAQPTTTTIPEPLLRPLAPIHYRKREENRLLHDEGSKHALSRQQYEMEAQKVVEVVFWDAEGEMMEFECRVKTFPMFVLTDAPEYVRQPIGEYQEVYDFESGRWKAVEASIPRKLKLGQSLLFRASGTYGGKGRVEPREMRAAMQKQSASFKVAPIQVFSSPKKRKLLEVEREGSPFSTPTKRTKVPSEAPTTSAPTSLYSSPELEPLDLTLVSSCTPNESSNSAQIPTTGSSKPSLTTPEKKEQSNGNSSWPLKYFGPMSDGLDKLYESEMLGTKREPTHREVFPMSTASLSTRNRAYAQYFNPDFKHIRDECSRNPRSTWKEYVKRVGECSSGQMPTFQDVKTGILGKEKN